MFRIYIETFSPSTQLTLQYKCLFPWFYKYVQFYFFWFSESYTETYVKCYRVKHSVIPHCTTDNIETERRGPYILLIILCVQ